LVHDDDTNANVANAMKKRGRNGGIIGRWEGAAGANVRAGGFSTKLFRARRFGLPVGCGCPFARGSEHV
jgi:hypothetical protein